MLRSAQKRVEAIYSNPKGVNPAVLSEIDRMALPDLVETKRRHLAVWRTLSLEDVEAAKKPRKKEEKELPVGSQLLELVREFLRVKLEHRTPTGAWAGRAGFPKDRAWGVGD